MMDKVYGDHVHQNDGTQLDGRISDDAKWQNYWRQLVVFPTHAYEVPSKSTGRRFISMVAELMRGIRSCKWNSECLLVFIMVVLVREPETFALVSVRCKLKFDELGELLGRIPKEQKGKKEGELPLLPENVRSVIRL